MPILNEREYIREAVQSVLNNDYPADRMELLIVDGMSNDGTRDILRELAASDQRIVLMDNPDRVQTVALNKGIKQARGDVIIRVDGHLTVAADFISRSVAVLREKPDVWCAGGIMETVGRTYMGRVIAAAMTSPFGVGAGNYRCGKLQGYTRSVPFGAVPRWVFDIVGFYDEQLSRNEDDDFTLRRVLAGGKAYLDPRIRSRYYCRGTLRTLARQYFQYGFWRIRTIQKHRTVLSPRQCVPLLFVAGWIVLILVSLWWPLARWVLLVYASLYAVGLLVGTIQASRRAGASVAFCLPLAFACLHFGYGLGMLKGIWSWIICRGRFVPKGVNYQLTR